MSREEMLRPIERTVLKMAEAGVGEGEMAWRLRRSPRSVRQIVALSKLPRQSREPSTSEGLRPIERRILRWRDEGADFAELASRFRRGPVFLEQVEQLARYKLGR